MAQRAFGIEQKSQGDNTRGADTAMRTVPLLLAPLLAPYRKQGRLSLRIERLHHLARLSAGRNNGDQSWSLTLDELEDLNYLLPEHVGEHTISLRIIGLNHGGATLAVVDHAVTPRVKSHSAAAQAAADPAQEREVHRLREELKAATEKLSGITAHLAARDAELRAERAKSQAVEPSAEREARALREELQAAKEELAGAKAHLVARQAELQIARAKPPAVAPTKSENGSGDIAAARAVWKAELDERLATAAAEAASDLERSRKVWQAEWSARLSSVAKDAEARVEQRISEAREIWQKENGAALSQTAQILKEEEAARFAKTENEWREKAASALAQLRTEADAAKGLSSENERRLNEKITGLEGKLAEKETALARGQIAAEQSKEKGEADLKALLAQAQSAWQTAEAARLALAEAQWKESAAQTLNAAQAEAEGFKSQASESERRLNEKIASLEGKLEAKETALARGQIAAETDREQWQRETEAAFAKAKAEWSAEEAARLAAAEAQWKENAAHALNEARAMAETLKGQGAESERRLNEKIAGLETRLTERDTALARAGIAAGQAQEQWQRESEAALSSAKSAWQSEEALRLAVAEMQWKEQAATALQQLRADVEAARNAGGETERLLKEKIRALEERLVKREQDIARAGIAAEEASMRLTREAETALAAAKAAWKAESEARFAEADGKAREQAQAVLQKAQAEIEAAHRETESVKQRLSQMAQEVDAALAKAKAEWAGAEATKLAAAEARLREQTAAAAIQARSDMETAQRRWQQEAKDALAKAETAWKADEVSRASVAEAQWRKRSVGALAEATARFEAAETALAQMRIQKEAMRQKADLEAVDRMHAEYRALQSARAAHDGDGTAEASESVSQFPSKIVLKHSPFLSAEEPGPKQKAKRNRPVLDVTVAVAIAASVAFYFYPRVEPYVPASLNSKIAMMTEGMNTVAHEPIVQSDDAPATPKQQKIVVANPVNMRAAPSATADVVSTALSGMEVEKLEQHGNWTRIRVDGKDGKQEGWVNSSYLKSVGGDKLASAKHD